MLIFPRTMLSSCGIYFIGCCSQERERGIEKYSEKREEVFPNQSQGKVQECFSPCAGQYFHVVSTLTRPPNLHMEALVKVIVSCHAFGLYNACMFAIIRIQYLIWFI